MLAQLFFRIFRYRNQLKIKVMKVQDLKAGDKFKMNGLTVSGKQTKDKWLFIVLCFIY